MPWSLRVLLCAIGAQILLDVAALVVPGARGGEMTLAFGALAIDLAVLALLARGSELARGLVRLAAGFGMALDALLLLGSLAWAPRDGAGLGAVLMATNMLATSTIAFAILGRDDVMQWVFARWLARHDADASPEVRE